MSNELVRRRLPESVAGRKIDAALTKLRLSDGSETRRGGDAAVFHEPSGAGGEIIEVDRVCAVHNKPYIAAYVRGADGRFRFSKSFRVKAHGGGSSGPGAGAQAVKLENTDPDGPGEYCAWCATPAGFVRGRRFVAVHCGVCETWVCLGRTVEIYFRCRDSCGSSGEIGDSWITSEGVRRKDANPKSCGSGPPEDRKPSSAPARRLLSDGNPGRFDLLRPDAKGRKP